MEIGLLEIESPLIGFSVLLRLTVASPGQLWWTSDSGARQLVLERREVAQGLLCTHCGVVVIPPERA